MTTCTLFPQQWLHVLFTKHTMVTSHLLGKVTSARAPDHFFLRKYNFHWWLREGSLQISRISPAAFRADQGAHARPANPVFKREVEVFTVQIAVTRVTAGVHTGRGQSALRALPAHRGRDPRVGSTGSHGHCSRALQAPSSLPPSSPCHMDLAHAAPALPSSESHLPFGNH